MTGLKPETVASKAVDIQKSLQDISLSLPHYYFSKTIKTGKVICLAANVKGFEVISPFNKLEMLAIELGIEPDGLKTSILPALEELNIIEIHKDGTGAVERIEERIPSMHELMKTVGKYWDEMEPTSIERSGIEALERTSTTPVSIEALKDELAELKGKDLKILMDCGRSGRFLEEYKSTDGETIVYSPMIWDTRSEDVLKLYSKLETSQRNELLQMARQIKDYPGLPLDLLGLNPSLIGQAIGCGFLEKGSTITKKGTKNFLFVPTPKFKLKNESTERGDLFDKVKAIISCVRHGQHFADITRILYPSLLLQKLLDRGYLKPHSESREQYAILETRGIVKTTKVGNRYQPNLIHTEENREALKTAIEILQTGEALTRKLIRDDARSLLITGNFVNPVRNRAVAKELPLLSETSFQEMLEILRGEK